MTLSPADHLGADELENPGGMTWREVEDFLDHMRETCIKDRQELKLEVRRLRRELGQMERRWRRAEQKLAEVERYYRPIYTEVRNADQR